MLIGPQGSGKGTQAEFLVKEYDLTIIEMGRVLRTTAEEDSERGRLINDLINQKGELLPDGVVFDIFIEHVQQIDWREGLIFDGFPRTVEQFNLLENYLADQDKFINLGIYLEISDETAIARLSNRVICTVCGQIYNLKTNPPPSPDTCTCGGKLIRREDDQPEAIKTRLGLFHQVTEPLLKILNEKGVLFKIDGSQSPEEVFSLMKKEIERKRLA